MSLGETSLGLRLVTLWEKKEALLIIWNNSFTAWWSGDFAEGVYVKAWTRKLVFVFFILHSILNFHNSNINVNKLLFSPESIFQLLPNKELQTMNETCSANFAGVKFESLWDKINTFFLAAKFNGLYSISNLPRKQVVFLSFLSVCFVDRPTNEHDFSQITLRKLQKTSAGPYRSTTFLLF